MSAGGVRGGWVYIMSNRPHGTLYVGVTSDLARRVYEHREGLADGFTKQYGLKRLVLPSGTMRLRSPFGARRR